MSAITTLTEILNSLVAERAEIENVDVDSVVKAKLAEIEAKVRAEVEAEIEHSKKVVDIKIETLENAIEQVHSAECEMATVEATEEDSEVSENIYGTC